MDYKCTAIVLKHHRLSEADKILHLYSPELGPIRAVAKSAFKVTSKLTAKSQVLNVCNFLIAKGRNLDIIKEAKLIQSFPSLMTNYESITAASFFVDIVDHIAVSDDHYDEPFELLMLCLEALDKNSSKSESIFKITLHYLWQFIELLGYKPDLNTCSITHKKRPAESTPQYFDFENGAITSEHGYKSFLATNPYQDSIVRLKPNLFRTLYMLESKTKLDTLTTNEISAAIDLLYRHLQYHLHKDLKSWKLLEALLLEASASPIS